MKNQEIERKYYLRIENHFKALNSALDRYKTAVDSKDEFFIFASLGEAVLWISTTDDLLYNLFKEVNYKGYRNSILEGKITFGMTHAFNLLKHKEEFVKLSETKGMFKFPFKFPVKFGNIAIWDGGSKINTRNKDAKEYFDEYVEGKEVWKTLESSRDFIEGVFEKLKSIE